MASTDFGYNRGEYRRPRNNRRWAIPIPLLIELCDYADELAGECEWRRGTTRGNNRYMKQLDEARKEARALLKKAENAN